MDTITREIVDRLSVLIYHTAKSTGNEQRYPSSDVDKMEDIISEGMKKLKKLREIREEFEDIESGYYVGGGGMKTEDTKVVVERKIFICEHCGERFIHAERCERHEEKCSCQHLVTNYDLNRSKFDLEEPTGIIKTCAYCKKEVGEVLLSSIRNNKFRLHRIYNTIADAKIRGEKNDDNL